MSCCDTGAGSVCPCGLLVTPLLISNGPELDTIAYRVGDFTSFRHALLLPRPTENSLSSWDSNGTVTQIWRPGASGDLAMQMVEWWAYLADVLTFYNERIANQAYLHTADLPESVNRLIQLLGYRPRPGIGATGTLAALATGPNPFTLPRGFQIQSKPGPGEQPQLFELDAAVTITPPAGQPGTNAVQGAVGVIPVPSASSTGVGSPPTVVIAGASSAVKVGDRVLLLPLSTATTATGFAVATVVKIAKSKDPQGQPLTSFTFDSKDDLTQVADVRQFHLLRSDLSSQVWPYPAATGTVIQPGTPQTLQVDLVSIVRSIKIGDPIVFEGPASAPVTFPQFGNLVNSTEVLWYANPPGTDPTVPPSTPAYSGAPNIAPIAVPHTRITFAWSAAAPSDTPADRPSYLIRYGWKDIGPLIVAPQPTIGGADSSVASSDAGASSSDSSNGTASTITLTPPSDTPFSIPPRAAVLLEDVNGNGAVGVVDGPNSMHLTPPVPVLVPPLRTLFNLLNVSRGTTVLNEVLGSGNSLILGQDFTLQKSPVTYLTSPDSTSGDNYSSTVRVWVNQVEWTEVRSFYNQPAGARVFLTREDDQGNTHVVFGTRVPTGVNNVVASYRYGSGADSPPVGSLTVVLQPRPGLRSIRNPVGVGGGSDPDPPSKISQLAPRSVLTFNRAVSVDDYRVIAAQTPGVTRAMAAVAFDSQSQRPRVTVWVGDDLNAVAKAQAAFAASADPNRLPLVALAKPVALTIALTIVCDPKYQAQTVQNAVQKALLDPDIGLFGVNVVGIGQVFYDSQIYATCLAVPGVVAIHSLQLAPPQPRFQPEIRFRNPVSTAPTTCSGQRHDPGQGRYFSIPNNSGSVTLATEAST